MTEATSASKHPSLVDRVYNSLAGAIARGEFPVNERLPGEHELAGRFTVSRPIVREALKRLRDTGIIYSRQGSGHFVRARHDSRTLGFAPVETIADIQRCYEFRLTVECDAAFYAAKRRNAAAIARIAEALDLMRDATRHHWHREDADYAFHCAVAEAGNNHYYTSAMQALKDHIAVGMKMHGLSLMGPSSGLEEVLEEHQAIFRAIESGAAEEARDRMRAHLLGSRNRLFEGRELDLAHPAATA